MSGATLAAGRYYGPCLTCGERAFRIALDAPVSHSETGEPECEPVEDTAVVVDANSIPKQSRACLNCQGTGTQSWPQSRSTNPRDPLERERLAPQVTKCGACTGDHP